ncbi:MAG TPA: hypothetical protein DEP36_07240, partial [Gammaproteobacteria bacterium]|nr:hypothetical protein [Gammaproteobacteria bacterium]
MLRRILFWLTALPLFLLLLVLSIAGFAISTETGLNGLLSLAQRVLPGQLSYGNVSGRLIGPLRIEHFRYADGPLHVTLASGELDWQPADLFDPALTVTHLHFDGLDLALPPGEKTPPSNEPFVLPNIQLPLAITVASLQGDTIRIQPAGADPIVVNTINLKVRTQEDGVQIEALEARSPLGEVRLSGQVNPTGAYPLQLQLAWKAITPDYGTFNGNGELSGTLRDELKLTQKVTGAAVLALTGEVRQALVEPAWSAQVTLDVADLKPFVPDLASKPLSVQLNAKGVMARFEGQGKIKAT